MSYFFHVEQANLSKKVTWHSSKFLSYMHTFTHCCHADRPREGYSLQTSGGVTVWEGGC